MAEKFKIYNATELWQKETSLPSIPTFSQTLDKVLGNDGIQLGSITEILGLPGSGKTQLCLQLCASVQIPIPLGGLSSEALFIDTNTNFTMERFKEILSASLMRCQKLLNAPNSFSEEDSLKKFHYVNAFGLEKFCSLLACLPSFIRGNNNIKLIVIDSITFPFKEGITLKQRTGLLFRLMADLHKVAEENQIAVVLTNEMSTRVGLGCGAVVGALGDGWAHRANKRLLLTAPDHTDNVRFALLQKSNNSPMSTGKFQITHEGIRDVE